MSLELVEFLGFGFFPRKALPSEAFYDAYKTVCW